MLHGAELGRAGEDLAANYLRARGWVIVERRRRFPDGCELDIVARDGRDWVFVEVKTRAGGDLGDSLEAVGPTKLRRFRRAVRRYVFENGLESEAIRCDVIGIDFAGDVPRIRHIPHALTDLD